MSLEVRQEAERYINLCKDKTKLPILVLLKYAGIPYRTWYERQERRGIETKHNNNVPKYYYLTPYEVSAIVEYCSKNALKGYRIGRWWTEMWRMFKRV